MSEEMAEDVKSLKFDFLTKPRRHTAEAVFTSQAETNENKSGPECNVKLDLNPFAISAEGDKQTASGSVALLQLLWSELDKKKQKDKTELMLHYESKSTSTDHLLKSYLSSLSDFVQRYDNEKVGDMKATIPRNLDLKDWTNISGVTHSKDGSVGVTFIECIPLDKPKGSPSSLEEKHTIFREIIVAKPCSFEEFANQKFLCKLAQYCQINVPQVRLTNMYIDTHIYLHHIYLLFIYLFIKHIWLFD